MSNGIFGDEFDSFWNLASIISEKKKKPKEEPQAHEEIEEKPQEQSKIQSYSFKDSKLKWFSFVYM